LIFDKHERYAEDMKSQDRFVRSLNVAFIALIPKKDGEVDI
jgi:hypothetical protein